MPPKRLYVDRAGSRGPPPGFLSSTYSMLTSSENAAVVRSLGIFGVGPSLVLMLTHMLIIEQVAVTFLASSWGELLLPPCVPLPKMNISSRRLILLSQ